MKYRKCKFCGSEFVVWNWIYGPFWRTWFRNFLMTRGFPFFRWKFWKFFGRWSHECWNCGGGCSFTFLKVRNGIPYEELSEKFVYLPRHEVYSVLEELQYIVSQAKHYQNIPHDTAIYERRRKMVIDMVNEVFDKQWELDHPILTKPVPPENVTF